MTPELLHTEHDRTAVHSAGYLAQRSWQVDVGTMRCTTRDAEYEPAVHRDGTLAALGMAVVMPVNHFRSDAAGMGLR